LRKSAEADGRGLDLAGAGAGAGAALAGATLVAQLGVAGGADGAAARQSCGVSGSRAAAGAR
jgi:hypothetical protein